ncbi:FAD-dependent oxidoreductase, partial [Candidatus Woesearchaeota archaeon CG10_big_fil_rev_8_21_14_0_10_30_7]
KISKEDIAKIEPKIVEKRDSDENILALFSENGYAVDFGKLSESFVKNSLKTNKNIDVYLNTEVIKIEKKEKGYTVVTGKNILKANVVVVATAGHSLLFAHSLGYGKKYILLPVAGSFFKAEKMLNGKVYTMQIKKLPFAAIHGDPDILNSEETRFGPTAKVLPMLERYHYRTVFDFFKLFEVRLDAILALIKILSDKIIFKYVLKNFIYDIPLIGKIAFLKQVRKIIPSIKLNQLKYLKKVGGIRPQIVDVVDKKLEFGESKIIGENIIFDITPSPGASTCLSNAEKNTKKIVEFFGNKYKFNREKFMKDFDK